MKVTTTAIDEATLTARIILDKEDLRRYVDEVKAELGQELTVDGFRKGKAPKEVVNQRLSPELVRSEALQHALEGSFSTAAREQEWDVARTDELKVERNDAEALEYTLMVTLWPHLTLPKLEEVHVSRRQIEITDAEIDEALDTLRTMRSSFLDKTGPAAVGDRVEVDFDATLNGIAVEGGSSRNHPLVIGGKNFMPGFEEALVGLAPEDIKTFTLTAPADYYEPMLAGKQVDFKVTMRRVQAVLKPAADDAFAKAVGPFSDLNQLKEQLRVGVTQEKQETERQRLQLAILDAITEKTAIPAPRAMVERELDTMLARFNQDLARRGMELPLYLSRLNKTEQDLRADWRPGAQRQVRNMLVIRQVAQDQKVVVAPEELDAAVTTVATEIARRSQGTPDQIDPEQMRASLADRLLTEKVLSYLEQVCTS